MKAYFCDQFVLPLPLGHRFPMQKYKLLRDQIALFFPLIELTQAPEASDGQLALVHTVDYIEAVVKGQLSAQQQKEIGFPWSEAMVERSRRSVGATVAACQTALNEGIAGNLAGGTHHAYSNKGSGFCVFNDVAVASRMIQILWARQNKSIHSPAFKVAIIDLDVHQGDGTATIFKNDDSVWTLSIHGATNFPFQKQQSSQDVALADGCDDKPYCLALKQALVELEHNFKADFVIYVAGADPLKTDRLGKLSLSPEGLQTRDKIVFEWAYERRLPLAFCMAGGYSHSIADTVNAQKNTFEMALFYWQKWQERRRSEATSA